MTDPVIAEDGHTYERAEIQRWYDLGHATSPKTNKTIGQRLVPNQALKTLIGDWKP